MNPRTLVHSVAALLVGATLTVRADLVLDWNTAALHAIKTQKTAPPMAARNLAILHASIFDAVNGIKQPHEQHYHSYLVKTHANGHASEEAAISAAAHKVMVTLFPDGTAQFYQYFVNALAELPNDRARQAGVAWGELVARTILAARVNDGAAANVPYTPGVNPGDWAPTSPGLKPALYPQWPQLACFAMVSGAQFRPPTPPRLETVTYATDFNLTKRLGATHSTDRTAEQTLIANFWADGAGTVTPPGHWNVIAQDVSKQRHLTQDQNARMFALLNLSLADAGVVAWDAKYAFNYWRPITAIRNADRDTNAATEKDAAWTPLLVTPPFPEYISGHSTFSGAAATVLARFFGTDRMTFVAGSEGVPGVTRTFLSFSQAAAEAGVSRIYGGIHFMSANTQGLHAGAQLGNYVCQHVLKPHRREQHER